MDYYRHKRISIELGHIREWKRKGKTSVQPDQKTLLLATLERGLRLVGLFDRGRRNASNFDVRCRQLLLPRLPAAWEGFRILQLSDIHAGAFPELGRRVAEKIRGLKADVCVLTGDYFFKHRTPTTAVYAAMEEILRAVNARHGVVGVLGNHDTTETVRLLESLGVKMLLNDVWEIENNGASLCFVGLDDPHCYGCDDLPSAVKKAKGDALKILLVHSPELAEEAPEQGIDLYLCGHTHGGQVCLPGIGPLILNASCPRRYKRGLWRCGGMVGYTSRGIGPSGVAVRFNCPPEISVFELHGQVKIFGRSGDANRHVFQHPERTLGAEVAELGR